MLVPNSDCVVKYEIEQENAQRPRKDKAAAAAAETRGMKLSAFLRNFITLEIIQAQGSQSATK